MKTAAELNREIKKVRKQYHEARKSGNVVKMAELGAKERDLLAQYDASRVR